MTLESNVPIAHGGALSEAIAQYGGSASEWLDLSTGISPFSLPLPELPTDCWRRLPERAEIERVCELAKRHYGASVVPVAVPGTQAAIQLLPFLTPNASEVAIVSPTYGEYARAYQRMDVAVDTVDTLDAAASHARRCCSSGKSQQSGRPGGAPRRCLRLRAGTPASPGDRGRGFRRHAAGPLDGGGRRNRAQPCGDAFVRQVLWSRRPPAGLCFRRSRACEDPERPARALGRLRSVAGHCRARLQQARSDQRNPWQARQGSHDDAFGAEDGAGQIVGETALFFYCEVGDGAAVRDMLASHKVLVRAFDHSPSRIRIGLAPDELSAVRLRETLRLMEPRTS
jgi:cobalamin biosynthetic protein CobC